MPIPKLIVDLLSNFPTLTVEDIPNIIVIGLSSRYSLKVPVLYKEFKNL